MVVRDELVQVAAQPTLVPDNHVIEALAPKGTDQAFDGRLLPGCVGRGDGFPHAKAGRGLLRRARRLVTGPP
jgi:hypothetical protein